MKSTICHTWAQFDATGPGAVLLVNDATGNVTAIWYRCPCCGRQGMLPIRQHTEEPASEYEWDHDRAAPTVMPVIVTERDRGGCGRRWILKDGEFNEC